MIQDIDTASDVQRYPIGMRYAMDDRVFRYAKAGGTLNTDLGANNTLPQMIGYSPVQAALLAAKTVVIDVVAGGGKLGDGVIALNELAGGYINIYTHELIHPPYSWTINRRIVTNTAIAGAEAMTLTIDKPLPVALTGGDTMHAEGIASLYMNVQTHMPGGTIPNHAQMSIVGMPTVYATVGQYLWLQTWGPVWCAPSGKRIGEGANNRQVVFRADGAVSSHDITDPANIEGQHAGFALCNAFGGARGVAIFFLQISP